MIILLAIQQMNFLKILYFSVIILTCLSSDCNLDRFPTQIHLSSTIQSYLNIEDYVIDDYPLSNKDFNTPLMIYQIYTLINSSQFVERIIYPYYVKVVIIQENKIQFQKWNLETRLLMNISQVQQIPHPEECRFYSIEEQFIIDLLIHCENKTHHRQYMINNFLRDYPYVTLLIQEQNIKPATQIIFLKNKVNNIVYSLIRKNNGQIIHLYQFSSTCTNCKGVQFIKQQSDWVKKQTGLNQIQYKDYIMLRTEKGLIQIIYIKNYGVLIRFQSYYFDRWYLENQIVTGIVKIQIEGGFAVLTQDHMYFLSVWQHQRNEYRLVTKQLSKRDISQIEYTQAFSVGEFVILADGLNWNVYYLHGDIIKHFVFQSAFKKNDIHVDNYHFMKNSFLVGNKHYLLRKPSLKLDKSITKQVVLQSKKCSRIILIKSLAANKVEVINEKISLIWKNGQFYNVDQFCQGNNVSSSLFIKSKNYNVSKIGYFRPRLPQNTQILTFIQINSQLLVIVTRQGDLIELMSCFKSQTCYSDLVHEIYLGKTQFNANYQGIRILDTFLYKQMLLTIVWDTKYYYTLFDVFINKLQLKGGWESPMWKFKSFQFIGYTPSKRSYCSQFDQIIMHFAAYSQNKFTTNYWAHSYFENRRSGGGGTGFSERSDIMFEFMNICSISNSGMEFLLYEFKDGNLNVKSIEDRNNFYLQKGYVTFSNLQSNKAICSSSGLAVFNNTQILFISSDLKIISTIILAQNTQNDKISGQLLLHYKTNFIVQIYNIKNGFLITQLNLNIDDIIPVKQASHIIGLKNSTFVKLTPFLSTEIIPETFALINCFNGLSSVSKLININVVTDLLLPTQTEISNLIDTNLWNVTINKLKAATPLSTIRNLTFFIYQPQANYLKYSVDQTIINRQIYGQFLQISLYNDYCMRQVQSTSFYYSLTIQYGNSHPYYFGWSKKANFREDIFLGVTNFYKNTISIAGYCQSSVDFITMSFDSAKLSNVQITNHSCPVNVWIQNDFQINRRIFKIVNKIYMLRYQLQLWKSKYNFSDDFTAEYGNLPRRMKTVSPKIQIFTLSNASDKCSVQELLDEDFGFNEEIKDLTVYQRQQTTFLFILTTSQLTIINDSNRSNKLSIPLNKAFIKVDVRNDIALLVSNTDQSQVYKINWQEFPYAGSLQFIHTLGLIKQAIVGVIMEKAFILATQTSLVLYLKQNKKQLYSIENVKLSEIEGKPQKKMKVEDISYKNDNVINVQMEDYSGQTQTIQIRVLFSLDVSQYTKIIVQNDKQIKEYTKQLNNQIKSSENSLLYE